MILAIKITNLFTFQIFAAKAHYFCYLCAHVRFAHAEKLFVISHRESELENHIQINWLEIVKSDSRLLKKRFQKFRLEYSG